MASVVHPVAPTVRSNFLKALDIKAKAEGKTLPELMVALIEQEGLLAVMNVVAKYQERTGEINLNHSGEITSLASVLTGIATGAGHDTEVEERPGILRH